MGRWRDSTTIYAIKSSAIWIISDFLKTFPVRDGLTLHEANWIGFSSELMSTLNPPCEYCPTGWSPQVTIDRDFHEDRNASSIFQANYIPLGQIIEASQSLYRPAHGARSGYFFQYKSRCGDWMNPTGWSRRYRSCTSTFPDCAQLFCTSTQASISIPSCTNSWHAPATWSAPTLSDEVPNATHVNSFDFR